MTLVPLDPTNDPIIEVDRTFGGPMPTVHYISRETLRKHGIGHIPWELMNKNATESSDIIKKQKVITTINALVTNVTAEVVDFDGAVRINATGADARGIGEQQPPYSLTTT
jgi:hypothetical protein